MHYVNEYPHKDRKTSLCVCVCEKYSGFCGTQVETKQNSAGADSVCDRKASEIYAGRAA